MKTIKEQQFDVYDFNECVMESVDYDTMTRIARTLGIGTVYIPSEKVTYAIHHVNGLVALLQHKPHHETYPITLTF